MADYKINVKLDSSAAEANLKRTNEAIDKVGTTADRVSGMVAKAFAFAGLSVGIAGILDMADAYTTAQNKLKNVVDTTEQLSVVTQALFDISNQTRSSYESTVELYSRVGLAVKDLGRSQEEVLQFTKSLNQAVVLSGASANEASAGIIQLAQGMASGTLRGDELNSVLEQLPVVADVITQSMGITRGELRNMGAQGKITADIILDAFAKAQVQLEERFGKTIPTLSQAWTVFRNNLLQSIGELDQTTGATAALSSFILTLADNMGTITRVVEALAIVIAVGLVEKGIFYAIDAFKALNVVMMSNPWTALATVILTVVASLVAFSDKITLSSDGLVSLRDYAVAAFQLISEYVSPVIDLIENHLGKAISYVSGLFEGMGVDFSSVFTLIKTGINQWIALYAGFGAAAQVIFQKVREIILSALGSEVAQSVLRSFKSVFDFIIDGFRSLIGWAGTVLHVIGISFEQFSDKLSGKFDTVWDSLKPDQSIPDNMKSFGQSIRDAFLAGFGEDYVGKTISNINSSFNSLTGRAREASRQRIAEDNAKKARDAAAQKSLGVSGVSHISTVDQNFEEYLSNLVKEGEVLKQTDTERVIAQELLKAEKSLKRDLTSVEQGRLTTQLEANKASADRIIIDKSIDQLTREALLIGMTTSQRAIATEQLRLEDQLKRKLTGTEKEHLSTLMSHNQLLSDQAAVTSSLLAPVEEYLRLQEALNDMVGKGTISRAQYASILAKTDLSASLVNMRDQLSPNSDYDTELTSIQRSYQERMGLMTQFNQAKLLSEQESADMMFAINQNYNDRVRELESQRLSAQLQQSQQIFGSLATITAGFAGKQSGIYRAMFAMSKAFAIADATVKIAQGIAAAAANPWPANLAAMASVAAATASIVTSIQSVQMGGFQTGGSFRVGGSGGADSQIVAFRATPNEVVSVRTPSQQDSATGEFSGKGSGSRDPMENVRIVNVVDPGLVEDFLSSSAGERTIVNVLHKNRSQVRSLIS